MGTRLFIALAALGALFGLLAVKLLVGDTDPVHAAGVGPSPIESGPDSAKVEAPVGPLVSDGTNTGAHRVEAATLPLNGPSMDEARAAIARGEDPEGYGILIVDVLLRGEPYDQAQVSLRTEAEPLMAREDTEPWAFYLPAKSTVLLDIVDQESGWTQTETTLAPVAGDVRTLSVDLDPPQIDGKVLLQVRSEEGAAPIAEARVIVISESPADVILLQTDRRGNVSVPRGKSFSYVVNARGYQALSLPAFEDTEKPFRVVELRAFARLFGRIQSKGSTTTQVQLLSGDPESATNRRSVASATVDPSGAWAIEGLAVPIGQEAMTGMWVELTSKGTMRTLATDLRIEPNASLEVIDPWLGGLPIALEFVYPSGAPVAPGTKIFLRREATTEVGSGESVGGVADGNGRIEFPALYVGTWSCEVGPAKIAELVVTGEPLQPVTVEGFDCIKGTLRWAAPNDRSLAKTLITLAKADATAMDVTSAKDDGSFRFDFIAIASSPMIRAYSGDEFRFTDGKGGFYSSGDPAAVTPGSLDVALALAPAERKDKLDARRRVVPRPTLSFDK